MYISIDLGGTNTRVAASKDLKDIYKVERFGSVQDLNIQRKLIKEAIQLVAGSEPIKYICLCIPGTIDKKARTYLKLPNYQALNGQSFEVLLDSKLDYDHLLVENDALMAGLAEAVLGAGKDFRHVAYLTLSTGVGGALIRKGKHDLEFYPCEPGHQVIVENGRYNDRCGQHGCLESYVSGTSFEQIYKVKPQDCTDPVVWEDYSKSLARGVINICALWSPDVIVFGGKVSNKANSFLPDVRKYLKLQSFFSVPEIYVSEFGDDAGLYGGLVYIGLNKK